MIHKITLSLKITKFWITDIPFTFCQGFCPSHEPNLMGNKCVKCLQEITFDSNHLIQKSCQKKKVKKFHDRHIQTIDPRFLKFKERGEDTGNGFNCDIYMSLSSLWIRDCWVPEKINENGRILPHLQEWPAQEKASRSNAHLDTQGLYFWFQAKLSNKNHYFLNISNSHFTQLLWAYDWPSGKQNKVICVKVEVKFMAFHYFLWLVHMLLLLSIQCCKTLCIDGGADTMQHQVGDINLFFHFLLLLPVSSSLDCNPCD